MQTGTGSSTTRGDAPGEATAGADDGRTFANLTEARYALWRGVNDLDYALNDLRGDLSAVESLALGIIEQHGASLGPTADGLHHCASRALDGLRAIRELHGRLHEAAIVVRQNDATR